MLEAGVGHHQEQASAANTISLVSADGPCLKKGGGVGRRFPRTWRIRSDHEAAADFSRGCEKAGTVTRAGPVVRMTNRLTLK
jgi:hypothetical protein